MAFDFKDLAKLKWYYQVLLVAGVCGGLMALFWYQYLKPIEADIQTRMSTLDDLHRTIAKSLLQQKQLAEIKKQALELQKRLDMLKLVLPLEKETDQIFRAVQQQATTSALRIMRVTPRPKMDHAVFTERQIDMDTIGTGHQRC